MADIFLLRVSAVVPLSSSPPHPPRTLPGLLSPRLGALPLSSSSSFGDDSEGVARPSRWLTQFRVNAVVAEDQEPRWWEKNAGPNMIDVHSTEEFIHVLSEADDRLVIVEFYGTWYASCRALYPKLCRTAEEHPEILFIKVNFDENKPMCKRLNVRVLPYFHFYQGADGQLESFSCNLVNFQKIKDAIATHNTDRCRMELTTISLRPRCRMEFLQKLTPDHHITILAWFQATVFASRPTILRCEEIHVLSVVFV